MLFSRWLITSWLCVLLLLITSAQPSYASSEANYQQHTLSFDDTNPLEFDPQDFLATAQLKGRQQAYFDIKDDNRVFFILHIHYHKAIRAPPVI
ncbi:hypothetical protein PCIT_a1353 [Pseudoalteromonas citrea]|uniref:Uncharacterized protein n=2 Tax=Pseudoalteromonas citrea TaxID=43655 RepID=A0AAD4FTN9_9GAMM|nr:hypothetical protein PCIT_a1353 [Pseudoalteromonas citrea]